MKRISTLLCALFLLTCTVLTAQVPYALGTQDELINKQLSKPISEQAIERFHQERAARNNAADSRGGGLAYWASYFEAIENSGSVPQLIRATLWPDSSARIVDPGGDFYWFIHAMSQQYDPNSILLNDYLIESSLDVNFEDGKIYQVDSMAYFYLYDRVSDPSVIDTLRIYIYGDGNIAGQDFNDWPSTGEVTDVVYAFYNGVGGVPDGNFFPQSNIIETIEVLLGPSDTSVAFIAGQSIPLDIEIGKSQLLGVAFHFIPGQSYALGDVLFDNNILAPVDLNNFDVITFEEDEALFPISSVTDEGSTNQGGIVESSIRYQENPLGWNITYYPTFGFGDGWLSEHVLVDWYTTPFGAHWISGTTGTPCEVQFSDLSNVDGISTWLWSFGDAGGAISVDQSPVFNYGENGTFSVELEIRDGSGTTFRKTGNVVVNNCFVGVDDIASLVNFDVYPNPARDFVNLNVELNSQENFDLTVYNIHGQLVYAENIGNTMNYQATIDVSDFSAGIYTVKLQNGTQVSSRNFVVE